MTTARQSLERRVAEDFEAAGWRIAGELVGNGWGIERMNEVLPLGDDTQEIQEAVARAYEQIVGGTLGRVERILAVAEMNEVLGKIEKRFAQNPQRHEGCDWERVERTLLAHPEALRAIMNMEMSGHEPDVYMYSEMGFFIGTCSAEVPEGTLGCVYDQAMIMNGLGKNAEECALSMGVEILPLMHYMKMQRVENFDLSGETFLKTDEQQRLLGCVYIGSRIGGVERVDRVKVEECGGNIGWRGCKWVMWD